MPLSAQHVKSARLHLRKCDPVLADIIKKVGPCTLKTQRNKFHMLVRSIVSQQISTAAARTIRGRLEDLVKPNKIAPEHLVVFDVDDLREAGISRQKAGYILDLAQKVDSGEVDLKRTGRMDDEDVITELIKIKGIGRWTAQMYLMFSLGRLDVFPVDDLGIQNAIKKAYPKPRGDWNKDKLLKKAEPWHPYATIASWYLWRSLE